MDTDKVFQTSYTKDKITIEIDINQVIKIDQQYHDIKVVDQEQFAKEVYDYIIDDTDYILLSDILEDAMTSIIEGGHDCIQFNEITSYDDTIHINPINSDKK